MALPRKAHFKASDIYETPDDGNRYEVIDGELFVSPPPVTEHQGASGMLHYHLSHYLYRRNLGRVFAAPIGVELDAHSALQPDLVYVARERLQIVKRRGIVGAPDLVVEILSPSTRTRDLGVKLRRYASAGIPHYWTVDPAARVLQARLLTEREYELAGTYASGSIFQPALFPGLEIPIDDLWS